MGSGAKGTIIYFSTLAMRGIMFLGNEMMAMLQLAMCQMVNNYSSPIWCVIHAILLLASVAARDVRKINQVIYMIGWFDELKFMPEGFQLDGV